MFALAKLLILVLVTLFLQVLNSNQIEPSGSIPHVSFKTDLIHRDSSLSLPYYHDSSMTPQQRQLRATLGSISHGHNIQLSSKYFDQKDVKADVVPNGGDYLIKIAIGSPPVEFTTVVDTGSDLLWVQCSPCQRCIQQESPLFEPNKSSTYHVIPCNSHSCSFPEFDSGCIPNHIGNNESSCTYSMIYGDATKSLGILSTDTISFPLADATPQATFPSTTFGCGYDQQGRLGTHGDGIVGLGLGTLSLVSQLGPKINHKFSYCLTPLSSNVAGKLQFGLDTKQPGKVSSPLTNQDPPTFYTLTLNGISIGNSSTAVGQDMIIDSGTTLTFLPTSIYDSVKDAMKSGIELTPVPDPNKAFEPCYKVQAEGFNPPDVVFHFKGVGVVLKAVNTFREVGDLTCLAIVPTDGGLLFGNVAQINFEVGYDLNAKQISFAPADCTKY